MREGKADKMDDVTKKGHLAEDMVLTDQMHEKQNGTPLLSVIVPIYKVESYLDRCVQSIVDQTYKNLEIILVDDGSPDRCPEMCDSWKQRDNRIHVIHKANGGLSDARNVGIEQSHGEWLAFVDSDDYIMPDMYEKLMTEALRCQADIAFCGYFLDYTTHHESLNPFFKDKRKVLSGKEMVEFYFRIHSVEFVVAWNKLYRRSLFFGPSHIRYPVGKLHEDAFTTYKLFYPSRKIVWLNEELYAYVQRDGSIMTNFGLKNLETILAYTEDYIAWSDKNAPQCRKLVEYAAYMQYINTLLHCHEEPQLDPHGELLKKWHAFLGREVRKYLWNPYASKKDQLRYILISTHMYFLFQKIWRFMKDS